MYSEHVALDTKCQLTKVLLTKEQLEDLREERTCAVDHDMFMIFLDERDVKNFMIRIIELM